MKLQQKLFWLLIFFLPTQLGRHFWPKFAFISGIRIDYLAPTLYFTDILVIGILGLWGWGKMINDQWLMVNWLKRYWWVLTIFIYLLTNALFAQNQGVALYKFFKIVEFTLLGIYVAKTHYPLSIIHYPLSMAIVYSSLIALAQFIKQASLGGVFWWLGERSFTAGTPGIALGEFSGRLFLRPYGTFSHPNSLAGFFLVSLILIFGLGKKLPRWLKVATLILGSLIIILSFSQAVWLTGMIIGLAFLGYQVLIRQKKTRIVLPIFILFLLIFGLTTFLVLPDFQEKSVLERTQLTKIATLIIQSAPLTGVGLNNFIVHLPKFWQAKAIYFLQPVHNIYLLILAETGVIGFLIFLRFLFLTCRRLYPMHYTLCTSLTAILVLGLFDHYWLTLQQNQLLLAILFGICWSKKL